MNCFFSLGIFHIGSFILIIQYYLNLRQNTIQMQMEKFDQLLNTYNENHNNFSKKIFLKFYFEQIQELYQYYLMDLQLYISQLKRFITILLCILAVIITYILHFLFIIQMPYLMVFWMIIIFIGHIFNLGTLIYSSTLITLFNQNYGRWFFNTIQRCCASRFHVFNSLNYNKVNIFNIIN